MEPDNHIMAGVLDAEVRESKQGSVFIAEAPAVALNVSSVEGLALPDVFGVEAEDINSPCLFCSLKVY